MIIIKNNDKTISIILKKKEMKALMAIIDPLKTMNAFKGFDFSTIDEAMKKAKENGLVTLSIPVDDIDKCDDFFDKIGRMFPSDIDNPTSADSTSNSNKTPKQGKVKPDEPVVTTTTTDSAPINRAPTVNTSSSFFKKKREAASQQQDGEPEKKYGSAHLRVGSFERICGIEKATGILLVGFKYADNINDAQVICARMLGDKEHEFSDADFAAIGNMLRDQDVKNPWNGERNVLCYGKDAIDLFMFRSRESVMEHVM